MSGVVDDTKLFKRFLPSLYHLSLVKVALPLFNIFGDDLITDSAIRIGRKISSKLNESNRENYENYKRLKEILTEMPEHLRGDVYGAYVSMDNEVYDWKHTHRAFRDVECVLQWDCIGTIDRIKTAKYFIQNANNNILKRFEMACIYCLKDSILAIWEEMEVSGDAEHFNVADESLDSNGEDESLDGDGEDESLDGDGGDESLDGDAEDFDRENDSVRFWVRWIKDGCRVPWPQALLDFDSEEALSDLRNYSSFFPLLKPEERYEFLQPIFMRSDWTDFRLCLPLLSKDEEELLCQRNIEGVFRLYLAWPLRSMFLETAEKFIKYMNGMNFKDLVKYMLDEVSFRHDQELLLRVWDMAPDQLKDVVKACPDLFQDIEYHLESDLRKKKRKIGD